VSRNKLTDMLIRHPRDVIHLCNTRGKPTQRDERDARDARLGRPKEEVDLAWRGENNIKNEGAGRSEHDQALYRVSFADADADAVGVH